MRNKKTQDQKRLNDILEKQKQDAEDFKKGKFVYKKKGHFLRNIHDLEPLDDEEALQKATESDGDPYKQF